MLGKLKGLLILVALLPSVIAQSSISQLQARLASPPKTSAPGAINSSAPGPSKSPAPGPSNSSVSISSIQSPAPSSESNDLVALRILQQGSRNFGNLQQQPGFVGWLDQTGAASDPCSGWTGVKCNMTSGRVIALQLPNYGIETRLPPELSYLTELQSMNLTGNNLLGGIPSNWGQDSIFPELQILDLSNNPNLSGALPPTWGTQGSFISLQTLRLDRTGVSGQLPLAWATQGSLPQLSYLNLSSNILTGTIPGGWGTSGAFAALVTLDLSSNIFTGSLPTQWGIVSDSSEVFPALQSLDLSSNGLTGYLPPSWGVGFTALKTLKLQGNSLTGSLPSEWPSDVYWQNLTSVNLAQNNLSGDVPSSWQHWFSLANISVVLFPGNSDLCTNMNFSTWAALAQSPNRNTRDSGSRCLTPPLRSAPVPAPQSPKNSPAPAPAKISPAPAPAPRLASSQPAPQPSLSKIPAPAPAIFVPQPAPVQAPVTPAPAPAADFIIALPVPSPEQVPSPAPEEFVPIPAPMEEIIPAPSPAGTELNVEAPAPGPEMAVPAPLPESPVEGQQQIPAPAPGPNGAVQVTARYNLTGQGLYPANQTVRDALVSAMNATLGGNQAVSLLSVSPLQTSRRKLLATTDGVQATYLINSTYNDAPGIVSVLNTTASNTAYREQLYNQGYQVQPVLSGTSIGDPAVNQDGQVSPSLAPSLVPSVPSSPASSSGSSLSGGAIAGIAAGSAVAVLLVLGILFFVCCRRRAKTAKGKKLNGGGEKDTHDLESSGNGKLGADHATGVWPKEEKQTEDLKAENSLQNLNVSAQKAARKVRQDKLARHSKKSQEKVYLETHSTLDSFELEEDVQRVGPPVPTASGELPPITEDSAPILTIVPPLIVPSQSSDPSPGTSVSDHTAMISEITPDFSSPEAVPLKKPKRNVSFADLETIDRTNVASPPKARFVRPSVMEDEKDIVAAGGYSRRHTAGETAIRKGVSQELKTQPKPNFEGHEIVGGGGGYRKRGDGEKVPAVSSYSRRPNSAGPRPTIPGAISRSNSNALAQPSRQGSMSRTSSSAMPQPSRQGSKPLARSASGIAAMMRLDEQLSAGLQRSRSGQRPLSAARSRELGGQEASSSRPEEFSNPVFSEAQPSGIPERWSTARHSSNYLSGHSPAGFGGQQTSSSSKQHKKPESFREPRRQKSEETSHAADLENEKKRKLRSWHRREVELGQICLHRNFEQDPVKRAEITALIDQAVEKLLLANKEGREEEAQSGMSTVLLDRMTFCDTAINFFNKLLPLNDEAHLPLLRRTVKMVDAMDQKRGRS